MELPRRGRSGPVLSSPEPAALLALACPPPDVPLIPGVNCATAAMIRAEWARQAERNHRASYTRQADGERADRNAEIIRRYLAGENMRAIGADYGLGKSGVEYVVARAGVCGQWGGHAAGDPKERQRELVTQRRRRLHADGLCIVCGQRPATAGPRGGASFCDRCRAAHAVATRRVYERNRSAA